MSIRPNISGKGNIDFDTLFLLVPTNEKAEDVVKCDNNEHLVAYHPDSGDMCLKIGFNIGSQHSKNTLATLGRFNCDVYLRSTTISRLHCSFEIDDLDTGIVMFYDRSLKQNTRVSRAEKSEGEPFEPGRLPRRVLVCKGFNDKISIGGAKGDLLEFKLHWILDEIRIRNVAREHQRGHRDSTMNPNRARTCDPTVTELSSVRMTPDQAFQMASPLALRFHRRELLGTGTFGQVFRAVDVDSGRVMAMKQVFVMSGPQKLAMVQKVRMEVELMRRAKHEHIADLITSQGWEDESEHIKIFMGLETISLEGLSVREKGLAISSVQSHRCLQQMLSALDFLAEQGIVHRDVKPENILYSHCSASSRTSAHHFRLADFGVGKLAKYANSYQGTRWYMAPEILRLKDSSDPESIISERQSPRVDVWSLFVTIAYARNECNYRNKAKDTYNEIISAAKEASTQPWMSNYNAMAIEDPTHRATARDILNQHFDGLGVWDCNNDDAEMTDINDTIFMGPQPTKATTKAPRRIPLLRQALSPDRPLKSFKIEKRKSPHQIQIRLNQTAPEFLKTSTTVHPPSVRLLN